MLALYTDDEGLPRFLESCVGCGLCVLRCPVGAIAIGDSGRPHVESRSETLIEVDEYDGDWLDQAEYAFEANAHALVESVWNTVGKCLRTIDSGAFYPLVARLLCAVGLQATEGRAGDTSSRTDVGAWFDGLYIPVEVKSYRESPEINVKAVQQALENKIIALSPARGHASRTERGASSLAIGYAYPSDRSAVVSMIADFQTAYGFSIGVMSARDLYVVLASRARAGGQGYARRIAELEGVWE